MANLREATAVSMDSTNLGSREDGGESHADRIGALAFSDRLAALLWHLKYNNDRKAFKPAQLLLARHVYARGKYKRWHGATQTIIDRMCEQVLKEWLADFCQDCMGRGIIGGAAPDTSTQRKKCVPCKGAGFIHSRGKKNPHEFDAPFSLLGNEKRYCPLSTETVRHTCAQCNGLGYTLYEPTHKAAKHSLCPTCKGNPRIRKISWQSRIIALGVPQESYHRWERRFDDVMDMIISADRKCNVGMNIQLERLA